MIQKKKGSTKFNSHQPNDCFRILFCRNHNAVQLTFRKMCWWLVRKGSSERNDFCFFSTAFYLRKSYVSQSVISG